MFVVEIVWHFHSHVPYAVTERWCCRSNFLARVILGGLPLPSQKKLGQQFGTWNLFSWPAIAHLLFLKDTVGSITSTN